MPRPRETKRRCSLRVSQVQRGLRTRSPRGVRSPPHTLARLASRCFEISNYERRGMTRNLLLGKGPRGGAYLPAMFVLFWFKNWWICPMQNRAHCS
jgi:hypothetical protein